MWVNGCLVAHGLCNTTWWFCGTCQYISSHKGSYWCDKKKTKRKELSRTKLDRLAKGVFVKVESMAWDVWIHVCSHGFLGCGYGFEGFHGCIVIVFLLKCFWRLNFSLNEGFPGYILSHNFLWVCCLFPCMWILILY